MCSWVIFVEVARNFDLRLLLRGENFFSGEIIMSFYCANTHWLFAPDPFYLDKQGCSVYINSHTTTTKLLSAARSYWCSRVIKLDVSSCFPLLCGGRSKSLVLYTAATLLSYILYRSFHSAGKLKMCVSMSLFIAASELWFELKVEQLHTDWNTKFITDRLSVWSAERNYEIQAKNLQHRNLHHNLNVT